MANVKWNIELGGDMSNFNAAMKEANAQTSVTYKQLQNLNQASNIGLKVSGTEMLNAAQQNVENLQRKVELLNAKKLDLQSQGIKDSDIQIQRLDNDIGKLTNTIAIANKKVVDIKVNNLGLNKFKNFADEGSNAVGELHNKMTGLIKTGAKVGIGAALVGGIYAAKDGLQGLIEDSSSLAVLASTVEERFKGVPNALKQSADMVDKISQTNAIDDGDVRKAVAFGASFVTTPAALEKITQGTITAAQAMEQNLNPGAEALHNTMNQIGKAVATGSLGGLAKMGITMDETQKRTFAAANEMQRATMIQDIMTQNFGNMSAKLQATPEGKIQQLTNKFHEVTGSIMEGAMPMLDKVLAWAQGFGDYLSGVNWSKVFTDIGKEVQFVWGLVQPLVPWVVAYTAATVGMSVVKGIWDGIGKAIGIVNLIMEANPMTLIIGGIIAAVIALSVNWQATWKLMQDILQGAMTFISDTVGGVFNGIKTIWDGLVGVLSAPFRLIGAVVSGNFSQVGNIARDLIGSIGNIFGGLFGILTAPFEAAFKFIGNLFKNITGFLSNVIGKAIRLIPGVGGAIADGLHLGGKATGGWIGTGGVYKVNEHGQEMVTRNGVTTPLIGDSAMLLPGDKVTNATQTQARYGQQTPNNITNNNVVNINGATMSIEDIANVVKQQIMQYN